MMAKRGKVDQALLERAAMDQVKAQEAHSLQNWGGWGGWLEADWDEVLTHLRLRKALGLGIPADLHDLAEVLKP